MKYIKNFEDTTIEIKYSKKVINNFVEKLNLIFKKNYFIKEVKLNPAGQFLNTIEIIAGPMEFGRICMIEIEYREGKNINIVFYENSNYKLFIDFILNFFNINRKNSGIYWYGTNEELDNLCDKMVEEFELYIDSRKFNI